MRVGKRQQAVSKKTTYQREWFRKRYASDPEFRARVCAQACAREKRRRADPEYRERQNAKVRAAWAKRYRQDPEFREKERARNRARAWRSNRLRRYGITEAELQALWVSQGHACGICNSPLETFLSGHIDHDHSNGRVRGILCDGCNVGLGMFGEDPQRLVRAAEYVTKNRMPVYCEPVKQSGQTAWVSMPRVA